MEQALIALLPVKIPHGGHDGTKGAGSRRKQQDDTGPQHGLGVVIVNIAEEGDQCFGHLGRDDLAEQLQQLAGIDAGAADDAGHADEQREKLSIR